MRINDWKHKRLRLALVAMGLISGGYLLCQPFPSLAPLYTGFVMGVLSAAGIFTGADTMSKAKAKPDAE